MAFFVVLEYRLVTVVTSSIYRKSKESKHIERFHLAISVKMDSCLLWFCISLG